MVKKDYTFKMDPGIAKAIQRASREEMKYKLLADIRMDLAVCELEGWNAMEYLDELKELINGFYERKQQKSA